VLFVSLAGTFEEAQSKAMLVAASVAAIAAMLAVERRSENRLLPSGAVTLTKPVARVYLTMFVLIMVLTSDIYIAYFLQVLHGVTPLISGYLTALVALSGRRASTAIVIGCVIETVAVASLTIFLARDNQAGNLALLGPAVVGMFMMGFGVGLGWAHLVTKILRLVGNSEQDKASAAISTVQSLGSAFGASVVGVITNSTGLVDPGGIAGTVSAAHWLYILMALPGLIAIAVSLTLGDAA
jgi:hypothetical protein